LAFWGYDYNKFRPRLSLGYKTPAEARRALAQNDATEYEIQTRKLSL
jgi:putative transposase